MSASEPSPPHDSERHQWMLRAPAWDRWSDDLAPLAERFNQPLIEACEIGQGDRVLDLASGAGEPALSIARHVGPTGLVVASDLVVEMAAAIRRRGTAAGLANLVITLADMTALPFAADSFDRVTCRFGLMFVPDPVAALREVLRVLRPGGITAWMVWGPLHHNTVFETVDAVAAARLGQSLLDRDLHPFRFAESGALAELLAACGYAGVFETELRSQPQVPADRPFWRPMIDMIHGHFLTRLDPASRRAFEAAVVAALEPMRQGDVYHLENHVRLATARKPG